MRTTDCRLISFDSFHEADLKGFLYHLQFLAIDAAFNPVTVYVLVSVGAAKRARGTRARRERAARSRGTAGGGPRHCQRPASRPRGRLEPSLAAPRTTGTSSSCCLSSPIPTHTHTHTHVHTHSLMYFTAINMSEVTSKPLGGLNNVPNVYLFQ